tara:strand:+ start:3005 stop:3265 length:261 start_codon:yes stop_codon:yes gene_type:complete
MKTKLYAVHDSVASVYGQVFQLLNDDIAKRTLIPVVNNPEHNYGMFPKDYTLYSLGIYDDEIGTIEIEQHEICNLSELVQENNNGV